MLLTLIIFFVGIIGLSAYVIFMMITHVFMLDYDALDFAKSAGIYLALLALNLMQRNFLGNVDIQNWFTLFINIGLWTHLVVPAFCFGFSMIVGNYVKIKQVDRMNNGY